MAVTDSRANQVLCHIDLFPWPGILYEKAAGVGWHLKLGGTLHLETEAVQLFLFFERLEVGGVAQVVLLNAGVSNGADDVGGERRVLLTITVVPTQ